MRNRFFIFMLVLLLLVSFSSCKKKGLKTEPVKEEPVVEKVDEQTAKMEKPEVSEEEIFLKKSLEDLNREGNLKKIHFDFDKYNIRDDMKDTLNTNANWLLKYPSVLILCEGHCDERGTIEYNMALGEKRAESSKNYLTSLGVSADRIKIISYGKNRPLVKGVDEESHFQNRRAEFVITKK